MKKANDIDQTGAFPTGAPAHGSQNGLTKREYFAAKAMQSWFAKSEGTYEEIAAECVLMADSLIKELEKNE